MTTPRRRPISKKKSSPYTQFLCVGTDEKHLGQLMTFTSSAWSGRRAFKDLIGPYLRKGKRHFPIARLGSKPRLRDPNGNIDPTFNIIDWAPRDDFAGMLLPAPETQAWNLPEPPIAPALASLTPARRSRRSTMTSRFKGAK